METGFDLAGLQRNLSKDGDPSFAAMLKLRIYGSTSNLRPTPKDL